MSPLWPALLAVGAFMLGLSIGWYVSGHPDRRPTPDAGIGLVTPHQHDAPSVRTKAVLDSLGERVTILERRALRLEAAVEPERLERLWEHSHWHPTGAGERQPVYAPPHQQGQT